MNEISRSIMRNTACARPNSYLAFGFENSLATSIGIAAPVDTSFGSAALTVMVATLPSNGRALL